MHRICSVNTVLILIVFLLSATVFSEEVSKFKLLQPPESANGKVIRIPNNCVAMDNGITVSTSSSEITQGGISSIVFVIDNSGSMWGSQFVTDTGKDKAADRWGARFTVARALLDTFYEKNPKIEVGISVFGTTLYFTKNDDPEIFEAYPANGQNSFIKLLQLNKEYNSTSNMKTGYDILKYYLQTDTQTDLISQKKYVSLKYKSLVQTSTNITFGFEGAKLAFKQAQAQKDQHYIVFFSDGDANAPSEDKATIMKFKDGIETPTSFSVFFVVGDSVPSNIKTMTENIKKNNYSSSNPLSDLWSIKTNEKDLMKLLMKNVIPKILKKTISIDPKKIIVNSTTSSETVNNKMVIFKDLFPLTERANKFEYVMKYCISKDSIGLNDSVITKKVDTTFTTSFTAEIQSDESKDSVRIVKWGRNLGLFFNNQKITSTTLEMKIVELRFSEYQVDTLYNYSTIAVQATSENGDKETFNLTKGSDYFSCRFPISFQAKKEGDGKLQCLPYDKLQFKWKNKDLPLDTVSLTIPTNGEKYKLQFHATLFNSREGISLPSMVSQVPQVSAALQGSIQKINENRYAAMLMSLEPVPKDSMNESNQTHSATFSIYDAQGTCVLSKKSMDYCKENKNLYYLWDGCNDNCRRVGEGSYAVVIHAVYYYKNSEIDREIIKPLPIVGIKK